ncbi:MULTISPECIES: hypothetical protein [unclassified Sphingomonas]|jgi:hypothetical protein|uniref:hypothetical protein n=1 Tax=unclassified Sphingomonas TaxID=196159 RepID=UPI000B0212A0|nr:MULTISPECIES: hypothetical protein [unclassified Sphingomonas]
MHHKLRFALTLAAAIGLQTAPFQAAQARPDPVPDCTQPPSAFCDDYAALGFATRIQCVAYVMQYCEAINNPGDNCYINPRTGQRVCQ